MAEKNIETYIDLGSSKIRIGIFDNNSTIKNFFDERNSISDFSLNNFNMDNSNKIIRELIQKAEKKIGVHINSVNLLVDSPYFFSIDISLKKNLEGKKVTNEDIQYLLQEGRQLIQSNYGDKKIIHIIIEKFLFDNKEFDDLPDEKIKCNFLSLEIKFLCLSSLIFDKLKKNLNENHLSIKNIFCSSYVKSLDYNNLFDNFEKKVFLDIGYNKTSITIFSKNKLISFNCIPIGGNHITNDISQVLKITKEDSETIKLSLRESHTIFSKNTKREFFSDSKIKQKLDKSISIDLLQKVIYARIDEILNLSFKNINFSLITNNKKNILIFIGEGSKLLHSNSIYLKDEFNFFSEMNFFEENNKKICMSGYNFNKKNNLYEVNVVSKKAKKTGFFEKLFHFFN